jgi:hypothetical protein
MPPPATAGHVAPANSPASWRDRWPRAVGRPLLFHLAVFATLAGLAALGAWQRDAVPLSPVLDAVRKLGLAALAGVAVTAVQRRMKGAAAAYGSLERAQVLLAVAGALTMVLIDNSIARAFGIAGAASVVRFRTPVEDPTDAGVLFLLMGIGMCSGVGAFGLAATGALAVCVLLAGMGTPAAGPSRRGFTIEVVAAGPQFPADHVAGVLARHLVEVDLAEWKQAADIRVRYRALADSGLSLKTLSAELMQGAGVASVSTEVRKGTA